MPLSLTVANTPQYVIGLHLCKGTLVARIHIVYRDPQAVPCKAAVLAVSAQRGFTLSQLQDSAYVLGGLQGVSVSPFLQPAEICLSGNPALHLSTYHPQPGEKKANTAMVIISFLWVLFVYRTVVCHKLEGSHKDCGDQLPAPDRTT